MKYALTILAACAMVLSNSLVARADPQNGLSDLGQSIAEHLGLEALGVVGTAPNFGNGLLRGGELHFMIRAPHGSFLLGGRFLASGNAGYEVVPGEGPHTAQSAAFDIGFRILPFELARNGVYFGAGGSFGSLFVDGMSYRYAGMYTGYIESGVEFERQSGLRPLAGLRIDLGTVEPVAFTRFTPDRLYYSFTFQLGFLLGEPDVPRE